MDLALFFFVVLLRQGVGALKLLHIRVPPYTQRGENVILECRYDLESDRLYSMSWYKDHEEFYRYVPKNNPSQHSYQVSGVKVDNHNSSSQKVYLQHVVLHTSGLYKCEVSAEAPGFTSVSDQAYMEVIALPKEDPTITSEEKVYASGDILALNCTSSKSYPPARLRWFINDIQVNSDFETTVAQRKSLSTVSTVSGLRLEVGPNHLSSGQIRVRCESTVQSSHPTNTPFFDIRQTEILVEGHASVSTSPSLSLLAVIFLYRFFFSI